MCELAQPYFVFYLCFAAAPFLDATARKKSGIFLHTIDFFLLIC